MGVAAHLAGQDHWPAAVIIVLATVLGLAMIVASRLERVRVEKSLAARQNQTKAILDASADAYVAMDAAGKIVAWSGQAERTFGWRADEVIGRTVTETIVPPSMRAGHDEGLARYLKTGHGPVLGTRIELEGLHRDGHLLPIELAVWEARGDGEPVFVSFIHDITERREKEAELAGARDKAMEASRLKSEFVANMSHEIRTPMNGVIGMAELMERTILTSEQRQYIETIRLSADGLLNVINDILDFSKIEAGKLELIEADFDLRRVVDEVGMLLAGIAHTKNVELATNVDAPIPAMVRGDASRLRQVLLNIAGNAVKFTATGEVVIDVLMDAAASKGTAVLRFSIRDTGPGISLEDQDLLFESFSQGDASSTRRHGGTGLGLAISKRLVELMDGRIGFESVLGQGSTFWFTARVGVSADAKGPEYPDVASLRGLQVLIVDDNATNRTILERTVSGWDMIPTAVSSADEALAELAQAHDTQNPFCIALLDYHMPGINGAQLVRMMADDPRFSKVHCVMLTSAIDRGGLGDDEVTFHLTKPVRHSALFDCIATAVAMQTAELNVTGAVSEVEATKQVPHGLEALLLVEDNAVNQLVARLMLESLGYSIDLAVDGAQAVKMAAERSYSAILMDCQMPVMDGFEATAALREAELDGEHMPIIAMTANAMEGDAERCLAAGMDAYLAKPVRIEELEDALDRLINQSK